MPLIPASSGRGALVYCRTQAQFIEIFLDDNQSPTPDLVELRVTDTEKEPKPRRPTGRQRLPGHLETDEHVRYPEQCTCG